MGYADLHIHTVHSYDGTSTVLDVIKFAANETDLDVIAITDHDSMAGVHQALDLGAQYGIEVIPGCEISTADGHLLALFIEKPVPSRLSLVETVLRIGEQGGVCIAAHPEAKGTSSLRVNQILQALEEPGIRQVLLGVEAFNGGFVYTRRNALSEAAVQSLPLAKVGSSDAHILEMVGQGASEFTGSTAQDLRKALEQRTTHARHGQRLSGMRAVRSYLPRYVLRKLGWGANSTIS